MVARVVMHVDMDAFYASVEQRERPELSGRPLIVGSPGRRGVVMTCSYEARRSGVRSAMPSVTAERLCPTAIWVPPRMSFYREVSRRIFELLDEEIPVLEPVSVDEAYGDLSGLARDVEDAREIARRVKQAVLSHESLTASVGVAGNRFMAKIASDMEKPDGLVVIPPPRAAETLAPLSARVIPGVGPKLGGRLKRLGIETVGEIAVAERGRLEATLGGRLARYLIARAAGLDDTPVRADTPRRQVSEERTYRDDLHDVERIETELLARAEGVASSLRRRGLLTRVVTIKVRDARFHTVSRSATLDEATDLGREIFDAARRLFSEKVGVGRHGVRLLGVAATGLVEPRDVPPRLFPDPARDRARVLDKAGDLLRRRYGSEALRSARLIRPPDRVGED